MTVADPRFFRPWRKRMGYSYPAAAKALNMTPREYWELEHSERPVRRFFAHIWLILWSPEWDWPNRPR